MEIWEYNNAVPLSGKQITFSEGDAIFGTYKCIVDKRKHCNQGI